MKKSLLLLILSVVRLLSFSQNMDVLQLEKLRGDLEHATTDTSRVVLLNGLAEYYRARISDSSFHFGQAALDLARKINFPSGESRALSVLSFYFYNRGDLTQALDLGLKSLDVARKHDLVFEQGGALIRIGNVYIDMKNYREALRYYAMAREVTRSFSDPFLHAVAYWRAADAYQNLNMLDSALWYGKKAEDTAAKVGNQFVQRGVAAILGSIYDKLGNDAMALNYYRKNLTSLTLNNLAHFFLKRGQRDSAIYYAELGLTTAIDGSTKLEEYNAALLLSQLYENSSPQQALAYMKQAMSAQDSIYGAEKFVSLASLSIKEKEKENELSLARLNYQSRLKQFALLGGIAVLLIVALLLYRTNRFRQKTNKTLSEQKEQIEKTLTELKSTQTQLIQSEKMASLGQLTAGIAHEIQNPLNFVNNFSEVNLELIDEIRSRSASTGDETTNELLSDIYQNNEKIRFHGQRADAIVKGMLQHSRASSSQKEPTDINALCDEYLRLSYHGLRARDKAFNARFETDFDPSVGKISLLPQDFGRVILNLVTNAFYAVNLKKNEAGGSYDPLVKIQTRKAGGRVEIRVTDNGPGIPDVIRDKIFQPFFTTKPTGQGTGLGLSLSYDIIIKGHGGALQVESVPEQGASFIITLPVS